MGPQPTADRQEGALHFSQTSPVRGPKRGIEPAVDTTGAMDNAAIDAQRRRLVNEVAGLVAEADRCRVDLAGLEQRLTESARPSRLPKVRWS